MNDKDAYETVPLNYKANSFMNPNDGSENSITILD